jgi:hypothetical protein
MANPAGFFCNESVEKVLDDPNHRNLGGLLPFDDPRSFNIAHSTHSIFLLWSQIFCQMAFSTAST